jgi:DNA integrity scanning protein DisA with diadenylate cyclase activity
LLSPILYIFTIPIPHPKNNILQDRNEGKEENSLDQIIGILDKYKNILNRILTQQDILFVTSFFGFGRVCNTSEHNGTTKQLNITYGTQQ